MIIDLGTFAVPATGTAPPAIPTLAFGSDVVGYLKIKMSGAAYVNGDFFGPSFNPSVSVSQDTLTYSAVASPNGVYDTNRGGNFPNVDTFYVTTLPADTLIFAFNQSANSYSADLEFHVVGSADITLQP